MPLNSQNCKTEIESSVAEQWGGWSTAVGRLLRVFTDVRAFLAKAGNSDTVFPCVFTSSVAAAWRTSGVT